MILNNGFGKAEASVNFTDMAKGNLSITQFIGGVSTTTRVR